MSFLGTEFNVDELPQSDRSFEPLPAGVYNATITRADLKSTKDGTGEMIAIRYDITGPSHEGRVVFGNINIRNKSSKAEEIGRQQLGEIMRAIGLTSVRDTDQLIGGHLQIKVDIEKREGYDARNVVKGHKAVTGSTPPVPVAAPAAPASNGAAPPWAKK